jgi:hypothetical protein
MDLNKTQDSLLNKKQGGLVMIKKMESSGNSGIGQLGLDGKVVGNGMDSLTGKKGKR